ncbi:hypothetical protein HK101_005572 [Irineochytrium annulatum]|nr:hypothetical protein HK101_005572 [Irineochytrium annulatum]
MEAYRGPARVPPAGNDPDADDDGDESADDDYNPHEKIESGSEEADSGDDEALDGDGDAGGKRKRGGGAVAKKWRRRLNADAAADEEVAPLAGEASEGRSTRSRAAMASSGNVKRAAEGLDAKADAPEDVERKKRLDDIWKSFNAPAPSKVERTTDLSLYSEVKAEVKTYEFAGETFSVSATASQSKAANGSFKAEVKLEPVPNTDPSTTTSTSASTAAPTAAPSPTLSASGLPSSLRPPRARPKSMLSDIAAKFGVSQAAAKLNTLEKSKLDWLKHVDNVGDADKLKRHNKDGYLEKKAFLERAQEKQEETISIMKKAASGRKH